MHITFLMFVICNIVGMFVITQIGALIQEWGKLSQVTDILFLLFTNLAFMTKIVNVMLRRKVVQGIIDEGDQVLKSERRNDGVEIINRSNKETIRFLILYLVFVFITAFGWAASAEKNQLPLRAWYPYDTSTFPAHQITYLYQSTAVLLIGICNVSMDQLVTSLTAVCCCRLQLVKLSLRTLCNNVGDTCSNDTLQYPKDFRRTSADDAVLADRLRNCIRQHQACLDSAAMIQECFMINILAQFSVSIIIICMTAYRLAVGGNNTLRLVSMSSYLLGMIMEVFLYCYQGHNLSEECSTIADAAYECPWYTCSTSLKRGLLLVMVRSRRVAELTVGGFAKLSLNTFVSIIKASYSFFTVLQTMEGNKT